MTADEVKMKLALLQGMIEICKANGVMAASIDGIAVTLPPVLVPAATQQEAAAERAPWDPMGLDVEDQQLLDDRAAEVGEDVVNDAYDRYVSEGN